MRIGGLMAMSAAIVLFTGCAAQGPDTAQSAAHGTHAQSGDGARPVLYDTLGSYSYKITTNSAEAQRWFDQGLRLVYGFNHHEAQRAFREAARLDPSCAMCFWGIAITEGSNYNDPTNLEREEKAATAAARQRTPSAVRDPHPATRTAISRPPRSNSTLIEFYSG